MLTGNGLARRVHIALIALLVLGVAGSYWMSVRARDTARDGVAEQAEALVDSSLTLVFRPRTCSTTHRPTASENSPARSTTSCSIPATSRA